MAELYLIATRVGHELRAPVKIGVSSNVDKRLNALKTASPVDLAVVYTFDVGKSAGKLERLAHETLNKFRLRGEWFDHHPHHALALLSSIVALYMGQGRQGTAFRETSLQYGCIAADSFCAQRWPEFYEAE